MMLEGTLREPRPSCSRSRVFVRHCHRHEYESCFSQKSER
jgi:hypothetical protein